MRRRSLLVALALGLALWGADIGAQQPVDRIGVLTSNEPVPDSKKAWIEGLRERGWVDCPRLTRASAPLSC